MRRGVLAIVTAMGVVLAACGGDVCHRPSAEPGRPSQGVPWASTTHSVFVPEVRFELTRPRGRPILSRLRLPFRHSGPVKGTREQG